MEVKFSFISNNLKDKLMSYKFILLCVEVILTQKKLTRRWNQH